GVWLERSVMLEHADSHPLGHFRCGVANVDLAAGDVVFTAVQGGCLGQPRDRVLGGRVRSRVRPWSVGRYRAVVDDAPPFWLLALHQLERFLGAEERAGPLGGYHRLPLLVGQILERYRRGAHAPTF